MTLLRPGPAVWSPVDVLRGARVTSFRVDLLDRFGGYVDVLEGAQSGGSLKWLDNQPIKSGGSLPVLDTGQPINWRTNRFRPVLIMTDPKSGGYTDVPLGVYRAAVSGEAWSGSKRTWAVTLTDLTGALGGPATDDHGLPVAYAVEAGADPLFEVGSLISDAGENGNQISAGGEPLQSAMAWEINTSRLQIINDILAAAGFFALRCDRSGRFVAEPFEPTVNRTPIYGDLNPFTDGESSLMSAEWTLDQDSDTPNQMFGIVPGDDENPAIVAVAENHDPNSPYSYENSDYQWFPDVADDLQATSQGSLDAQVQMRLAQKTSAGATVNVQHLFLPEVDLSRVVNFDTSAAHGDYDFGCYISGFEVALDALGWTSTTMHQVVGFS